MLSDKSSARLRVFEAALEDFPKGNDEYGVYAKWYDGLLAMLHTLDVAIPSSTASMSNQQAVEFHTMLQSEGESYEGPPLISPELIKGSIPSARVFAPEGWKLVPIEGNGQSEREAMSALVLRGLIRLRANAAWKEFSDKQYGFGGEDEKQAFLDAVTSAFVKAPLPTHTIGTVDLSDPQAAERVLDKMAIEAPRAWNDVNAEAISILIQRAGGELFIPNGPDIKVGTTFARVEEGGVRFRFSPKGSQ